MTIHSGNKSQESNQKPQRCLVGTKPSMKPQWSWAAPLAFLLWQGGLALAAHEAIAAEPSSVLVAQEFNFEAPPPPPSSQFPPVIVPRDPTLPTLEPAPAPFPNSPAPISAPPTRALPSQTYLVYVNGNSPLMLEQVRRVEPEAFRKEYRGRTVIQVGQFIDQSNARRRAEALQDQGIRAEVAQVSGSGSGSSAPASPKGYYVVIPASSGALAAVQAQVKRLAGDLRVSVISRDQPRGNHIAVGPFTNWNAANSWNRYVNDFGLTNARVYYGR
jgi:hypothetical protein